MASWNAAALFHQEKEKRGSRKRVVEQPAKNFEIVVVRGTFGGSEDFEVFYPQIAAKFEVVCYPGPTPAIGGIAVLSSRNLMKEGDALNHREIVPGRVLRCVAAGVGKHLIVWSTHNFGLTAAQVDMVAELVEADYRRDAEGVRAVVWIGGD
jgi:hypothetical protein